MKEFFMGMIGNEKVKSALKLLAVAVAGYTASHFGLLSGLGL